MPKKIRIRTQVGVDKSVQVDLNQDFDFLEILSLQFTQQELYTRMCADYGVIVGRVSVNNGYGIPNAKVSVFVPLKQEDEEDPVISVLYPYKSLSDRNEDGYRYNLLPYIPSYTNHTPTGTFPTRRDVLIDRSVIEVYDKYYKFTVTTNQSGDFMIFGVPTGSQTLIMNVDLSDIGEFSLFPQDLIRIGRATEEQVNKTRFKSSTNFEELPQIITLQKEIEVFPLWGEQDICQNAITRTDFDLTQEVDLTIKPTAVFMGSIFSTIDLHAIKRKCKVKNKMGNLCSLQTGPGEILAIRQTIFYDSVGNPVLEQADDLEQGGKVIDENGAWLIELPMNLEYITTNEFGERIISIDPNVGIPTKAKYRFKIKWEQPQNLSDPVKRAYFLVPNIKEWGWTQSDTDPTDTAPASSFTQANKSYAFSLDWADYGQSGTTIGDTMISEAINCQDRFYEFQYNKVYTVSQLIDQYRAGLQARRIISVKNISDEACETTNNPFPTNDAIYQPDIVYLLFVFLLTIILPIILIVVLILHIIAFILNLILKICRSINKILPRRWEINTSGLEDALEKIANMTLPMITYPDCEICECKITYNNVTDPPDTQEVIDNTSNTVLADTQDGSSYQACVPEVLSTFSDDPNNPQTINIGSVTNIGVPIDLREFALQNLFGGYNPFLPPNNTTCNTYCPDNTSNLGGGSNAYTNGQFSINLTLSERLNLFNTKMKYFDSDNFGLAPNQMKVYFHYDSNGANDFHYDNVFFMLLDTNTSQFFKTGQILSFQDPENKKDINTYGGNRNDSPFQVTQITGTTINNPIGNTLPTITVNYADPSNPTATQQKTYFVNQDPEDYQLYTFPADIEYFQVITAMTMTTYSGLCNPNASTQFPQSLPARFLFNTVDFKEVRNRQWTESIGSSNFTRIGPGIIQNFFISNPGGTNFDGIGLKPLECLENYSALTAVFLVRGVDPYSTRVKCKYDLSRLFGYTSYGNTSLEFEGEYKLNIPIQSGYRIPRHDILTTNSSVDTLYSNQGIFYPSYHFQPGNKFSAFTSNTLSYYSALDETKMGYLATNGQFYTGPTNLPYVVQGSGVAALALSKIRGFDPNSITGFRVTNNPGYVANTTSFNSVIDVNWFTKDFKTNNVFFRANYAGGLASYVTSVNTITQSQSSNILSEWPSGCGPGTLLGPCKYSDPTMWSDYTYTASTNTTNADNRGYYINESVEGGTLMTCVVRQGDVDTPIPYGEPGGANGPWVGANNTPSNIINGTEYVGLQSGMNGITFNGVTFNGPSYNRNFPIQEMRFFYFSPGYDPTTLSTNFINSTNIILRTDRLPTSDITFRDQTLSNTTPTNNNYYAFQQNTNFAIYSIDDQGAVTDPIGVSTGDGQQDGSDTELTDNAMINSVLNSLNNCPDMYPLECYEYQNSTIQINPGCIAGSEDGWFKSGCYILVRRPFITSYFNGPGDDPSDIRIIFEWATRFKINFALCRNVFGHMFTNNWINGTLFAYSFKNDRFFTSPTSPNPNQPYNKFCTDTIILQAPTNNFYYRSSPFKYNSNLPNNGEFIGLENERRTLGIRHSINSNEVNLLNPTTIIDLGPKNSYIQELVLNDDYDGYYMDRFNATTFGEVDDIINFFVISRLANLSFLDALLSVINQGSSGNILSYFSRVPRSQLFPFQKNMVDGDYAQMISINSELGVAPFDPSNYPDVAGGGGDNPMYFNGGNTKDGVIGIFFSSDTQFRDYVTPRRKIIKPGVTISPIGLQDFYNIKVITQYVPFYDWNKKPNNDPNADSIFGSQRDDWGTDPIYNSGFFAEKYQTMDRLQTFSQFTDFGGNPISNYFMTKDTSNNTFFKGYLYGEEVVAGQQQYTANLGDVNNNTSSTPGGNQIRFRVGAPFHFYFGLIKGASAIDKFRTKYVEKDFNDE